MSRPHWSCNSARQIVAPSPSLLTAAEQKRVPARLLDSFEHVAEYLAAAPPPFAWLADATRGLEPVLECVRIDDREHWNARLCHPFRDQLAGACFGFDAIAAGPCSGAVPGALAWMRERFGRFDLAPEQSGSAPFGLTLAELVAEERRAAGDLQAAAALEAAGFPTHDRWVELLADLPPDAGDWVCLYETDGDYLLADVARDETMWVGGEWTGDALKRWSLPWSRTASFTLWRLLDGGHVRPVDLDMLVAS